MHLYFVYINGNEYTLLDDTCKFSIIVAEITNYDGLFQIVPPEGVDDKLGSNIHYGEPFLLKTIEVNARGASLQKCQLHYIYNFYRIYQLIVSVSDCLIYDYY